MKTTTFFSYKGGSGRSTTCLNTIPLLALAHEAYYGAPILLLDIDIESAGLTYLLSQEEAFKQYDVKTLLTDGYKGYDQFISIGNKFGLKDNDAVRFLGVNDNVDQRDEVIRLAPTRIAEFKLAARKQGVSAIVFDSAAGDQATAEFAINNSDKIVMCMRPTKQFRSGTFNYLNRKINNNAIDSYKEVILLPTVVPGDSIIEGVSQLHSAQSDIIKRISQLKNNSMINQTFVKNPDQLGINEVTRFKWSEEILYKLKEEGALLSPDETSALERYKNLAQVIWSNM